MNDINRIDENNITIITFPIEDQLRDPDPLREVIDQAIEEQRFNILVDLENVAYVSSSVLGLFITTVRELQKQGGALKLLNPQPAVCNVLRLTRLDRIFELYTDRETALDSFPQTNP